MVGQPTDGRKSNSSAGSNPAVIPPLAVRHWGAGPDKPDLVLLHGWGFHSGIWEELAATLAPHWHIHGVDLPGHGESPPPSTKLDIHDFGAAVAAVVPAGAVWLGWSLGGMIALARSAHCPQDLAGVLVVAASPRFIAGPGWSIGMAPALLADFSQGVMADWQGTLGRFLLLQTRGMAREPVRALRDLMLALPPDPGALAMGLTLLAQTDLRPVLQQITCPGLVILGDRDTLVSPKTATAWSYYRPDWPVHLLPDTGHLPFITHRPLFSQVLAEFAPRN